MPKLFRFKSGLLTLLLLASALTCFADSGVVRVGLLQYGTVNWEMAALKLSGFDASNDLSIEVVPFASTDATKIALQAGAVDVIVSDWIWVSRQRASGIPLSFYRYSSSVGAIMVADDSTLSALDQLTGKKIGVAGGPLDKGWLLLQGMAKQQYNIDLAALNDVVYGAPPLLAEKLKQGELDANLNYWHFCARLESMGFRRLVDVHEAAMVMGAKGNVSTLGYVFQEKWANENDVLLNRFFKAIQETKSRLTQSDQIWDELAATNVIKETDDALYTLRKHFRLGVPSRPLHDEILDAQVLFQALGKLGGEKLVGSSTQLSLGTYWVR